MMKIIVIIWVCIFTGLSAIAQKHSVCYQYKIQYRKESPKDSSKRLGNIQYFDSKMRIIKDISLGPKKSDTCWTRWYYDKRGNLLKRVANCRNTTDSDSLYHKYAYDKNGNMVMDSFMQYHPFREFSITFFKKDSKVSLFYHNEKRMYQRIWKYKDATLYDSSGRTTFTFCVNDRGDTTRRHSYLYYPLKDTDNVRLNIKNFKKIDEIIYLYDRGHEALTEYYDSSVYKGSTLKKYNAQGKIILEQAYSEPKKRITSQITYSYDKMGNLVQQRDEQLDEKYTEVSYYNKGRLIRKDYIEGDFLDHSIVYEYKSF